MLLRILLAVATFALATIAGPASAQTQLRITWYSDGNEGEVLRDLLDRFEKANPDIKVIVDNVAFKAINESLPVQLAAGQGPDMARVTDFGGLAKYTLDLRPHLKDAAYFDKNFGPFLTWMRVPGDTTSIPGYMTQLTITGPFINKTLFEQAKVAIPAAKASWDDWAKVLKDVAAKVKAPFPLALDRSGHRFSGVAISMGAKFFDDKGEVAVIDDGFKLAAQKIYDWHQTGVMSKELWGSVSGATYRGANEEFKNGQVVMYMSGSWQIAQFVKTIGNDFDWVAVPTPCGPAGCTGMPGGAGLIAIKATKYPKETARVMEYLASEPVLSEFYARTLFVPGHLGIAAKGVDYRTDSALAKAALNAFSGQVATTLPLAYRLQGHPHSRIIFNASITRLGQAIVGEMKLDDAYRRIADDVKQQIAEQKR